MSKLSIASQIGNNQPQRRKTSTPEAYSSLISHLQMDIFSLSDHVLMENN
jgi:hypothetical protein